MRKAKGQAKARRKAELVRALEERALAKGLKPFKSLKDVARMRAEDADELLAAIRLLREADGRPRASSHSAIELLHNLREQAARSGAVSLTLAQIDELLLE